MKITVATRVIGGFGGGSGGGDTGDKVVNVHWTLRTSRVYLTTQKGVRDGREQGRGRAETRQRGRQ